MVNIIGESNLETFIGGHKANVCILAMYAIALWGHPLIGEQASLTPIMKMERQDIFILFVYVGQVVVHIHAQSRRTGQ